MIALVLLIALVLRLIGIDQSFWLDEAINVTSVKALDFHNLIFSYSLSDFHPPLYHVVLKAWLLMWEMARLPVFELTFRLPSVIFGVTTVYVVYLISRKLFTKTTALIAATLAATAPLLVYYSQEARMYSLACLLTVVSVYFFLAVLERDKLSNWVGFIVFTTLMLYLDYLPYLMLPTYVIYLLICRKKVSKGTLKSFFPAFVLVFALLLPWLFIFPKQLRVGLSAAAVSPAWAQVVGSPQAKDLPLAFVKFTIGRISIGDDLLYAVSFLPIAIFIAVLFLFSILRTNIKRSFLYLWLLAPTIMAFILAFFVPVFSYFRLLFVVPAYCIILASGITILRHKWLTRILLTLMITINIGALTIFILTPAFHREDWRNATQHVVQDGGADSVVLFESDYTTAPFDYYLNEGRNREPVDSKIDRIKGYGGLDGYDASKSDIKSRVAKYTKDKKKVFLFQYLSGITDPQGLLFKEISAQGFYNTKTRDFNGVGFVYEFVKY